MKDILDLEKYILGLENAKLLDPDCKTCTEIFYPKIREGKKLGSIFAPRHKASDRCRSGKYPHCTCDTCF